MRRVQLGQAFTRHMRVNRGGGNVCVTQQYLYRPQIRSVIQQMGRKGMPQGVR